jgi:predicted PurR-regulated permease PerM
MPNNLESRKPFEFRKLIGLAYLIVILSAFSWAKEFLLPIVLAALISFLLMPIVDRLERWKLHPIVAVLSVVAIAFAFIGLLCATISVETLDLVNSLPKYRENITAKWAAIQQGPPGPLSLAFRNIGQLVDDLGKAAATNEGPGQPEPAKVKIISGADSAVQMIGKSMTPVLGPVAEFAVVVVLVVFILIERKQLRRRFLQLIGHSHMATTTLAVDEAGSRLSSFLSVQLAVNTGYAAVVATGLTLIGIPNAILWAILTLVLRFLPYVGLWISAFFPLALSIAISSTWTPPILTLLLYVVLEVFTNNVIEPVVLGGSTGMSPLAVIISALFWTWIWGPVGLLLATPVTACLVVLGHYFPAFYPYSVMLAADPPTSSETRLIRLLTENRLSEARALVNETVTMQLSTKTAEELLVPMVRTIENELFPGTTANQTKSRIYEQMRELIEELTVQDPSDSEEPPKQPERSNASLIIVPVLSEGDEIVGRLLARLLEAKGVDSDLLHWRILRQEKIHRLVELQARFILLSAVQPKLAVAIGKMARTIRFLRPEAIIMAGLWSLPSTGAGRLMRKIQESEVAEIYTHLDKAVRGIVTLVSPVGQESRPEALPQRSNGET